MDLILETLNGLELRLTALSTEIVEQHGRRDSELNSIRGALTDALVGVADQQTSFGVLLEGLDRRLRRAETAWLRTAESNVEKTNYDVVSYAQNQEDVVLSRLTTLVEHGIYVDIGAGHPVLENVTYALYRAGWRGVNVEPMPREVEMYRTERPDDLTLQVAIGAEVGTVTLYEAPLENRGATTSDSSLAQRYVRDGQDFTPFNVGRDHTVIGLGAVWAR